LIPTDNQELPRTISSQGFGIVGWQAKSCHWINIPDPRSQKSGRNEVIQTEEGRARLSRQEELGQVQAPRQRRRKT